MWEYNIKAHTIKHNGKLITSHAYSGHRGYVNDPSKVSIKMKGPIPPGTYTIGTPHNSHVTGHYSLNLNPAQSNVMYGRDAFRIHGDSRLDPGGASDGCIITDLGIRQKIWTSNDHVLKVTQ